LASGEGPLPHLLVRGAVERRDFTRRGRGDPKIREVEHRAHGAARKGELTATFDAVDVDRDTARESLLEELQALGVFIVLEGAQAGFPLKLESLESWSRHTKQPKRPRWLLQSVLPADESHPERATVWVSDAYRGAFLRLFEDYLEKTRADTGEPYNRGLVANIARIRRAVLDDLWQSDGAPPLKGRRWWELWLAPADDAVALLRAFAADRPVRVADRVLRLGDRTVAWVQAEWEDLEVLPFTAVPLAEIREPEFVDTVEDLPREQQDELTEDLGARITAADATAPAVCQLDTGVRRSHILLRDSLAASDVHSLFGAAGDPVNNHGTLMAGLALLGPLDDELLSTRSVTLRHRLESVQILPDRGTNDPLAYGLATAQAVALPEATVGRSRVFCMPVTAPPERIGEPSLWSASIDALAAGVDIARADDGIELLGPPDPRATRLFFISAGNVEPAEFAADYRSVSDLAPVEDPAHAWNALTVGASTELVTPPTHPDFASWTAVAEAGDISPHSRTSLRFSARQWPIKPDICMEGGNLLTDGAGGYDPHPLLSLRTTDSLDDRAVASAFATSAATAQAARLGALAQAQYPAYWPESIRGLLVHGAEWTPVMREQLDQAPGKTGRLAMLRRYGWGVPTEDAVLNSSRAAVTMVSQDEFVAFSGKEFKLRNFRLHRLPWPTETLRDLGAGLVTMRVTLSYFIEPTASRRGWRRRYAYASHGLRFELKTPTENVDDFVRRINGEAQAEEDGTVPRTSGSDRWLVGSNQRNTGSLHQDIWDGVAADLASSGVLAVHAVGGWWKNNPRTPPDRIDRPVRYSLIVSLRTAEQGVDLYTPIEIANEQLVPIGISAT